MPHIIHKSTGVCTYKANSSLLTDPDWKKPGWAGDANYHVGRENSSPTLYITGLQALFAAKVPAEHVKVVNFGGGVFAAAEMTPEEKEAIDLDYLRTQRHHELARVLAQTTEARMADRTEPTITAALDSATSIAELNAVVIDNSVPEDFGAMVGDSIHIGLSALNSPQTDDIWEKVNCDTSELAAPIGKSLSNGGVSNRILANVDCRIELQWAISLIVSLDTCSITMGVSKNGIEPTAAAVGAGAYLKGGSAARLSTGSIFTVDLLAGDYIELWIKSDDGATGGVITVVAMSLSAKRIA